MKPIVTAIIYDKRGNVLSVGRNSYVKTHTLQAKFAAKTGNSEAIFLHAEMDAIIKCRRMDKAHKIAVFRYDANGNPANSAPCEICRRAIKELTNIKIITHT